MAKSYNTRKNREKSTKTDAVEHVPVHPVLAAMLAEWKLSGWTEMVGHAPAPDDLIVPLPPDAAARRRSRDGEPFRGHDYSSERWREEDLPALGWRHRRHYDMRPTFITLAIDDGADADIIETRVTHTRKSRNAFDGYNRGLHWDRTCAEIAKLRITRGPRSSEIQHPIAASGGEVDPSLATLLVTASATGDNNNEKSWRRRESKDPVWTRGIHEDHVAPSTNEVAIDAVADPRDQALSHAVLQTVLDGNYERARCLAEEWHRLAASEPPAFRLVK